MNSIKDSLSPKNNVPSLEIKTGKTSYLAIRNKNVKKRTTNPNRSKKDPKNQGRRSKVKMMTMIAISEVFRQISEVIMIENCKMRITASQIMIEIYNYLVKLNHLNIEHFILFNYKTNY